MTKVEFYWGEWWYTVRVGGATDTRGPETDYEIA